jgi:hypothetical protein
MYKIISISYTKNEMCNFLQNFFVRNLYFFSFSHFKINFVRYFQNKWKPLTS